VPSANKSIISIENISDHLPMLKIQRLVHMADTNTVEVGESETETGQLRPLYMYVHFSDHYI